MLKRYELNENNEIIRIWFNEDEDDKKDGDNLC
jgi:hypothetical protein